MQPSLDGHLRLPGDVLGHLALQHLVSGLDSSIEPQVERMCGCRTVIAGYTEWIDEVHPHLSVGWDWSLQVDGDTVRCARVGLPYSNLMLVDAGWRDIGVQETLHCLARAIDRFPWQAATQEAVAAKYSG